MKKGYNIYDIAAWVAFAIVVVYFFLKIIGVLKSPVTVDIVALLSAAYFVGRHAQKMDEYTKKLDKYTGKFDIGLQDIDSIKHDLRFLNKKCPVFDGTGTRTR